MDYDEIYLQQKKYRKTEQGRAALRRAQKKYNQKRKIEMLKTVGKTETPSCNCCDETIIEFLNVVDDMILCYNCKSRGLDCPHLLISREEKIAIR